MWTTEVIVVLVISCLLLILMGLWINIVILKSNLSDLYTKYASNTKISGNNKQAARELMLYKEVIRLKKKNNTNIKGIKQCLTDDGLNQKELLLWYEKYKLDTVYEKLDTI